MRAKTQQRGYTAATLSSNAAGIKEHFLGPLVRPVGVEPTVGQAAPD